MIPVGGGPPHSRRIGVNRQGSQGYGFHLFTNRVDIIREVFGLRRCVCVCVCSDGNYGGNDGNDDNDGDNERQ